MVRRLLLIAGVLLAASACTPQQLADWVAWHDQDPAAAEAFANMPEIQDLIHKDTDGDGVVEPDAPAPQADSGGGGNWSVNWDKVARCESGGQWGHGPVTNRYGTFSGGLMIMNSAWRNFGGQEFANIAGNASKAQQIIVAERIVDEVGFDDAWQCHG